MNSGKVTAVVAVRKGSQRVPDKNIRPFGDSNLLQMKIDILKQVEGLDEIVVNSDCDYMLEIGKSNNCITHKRNQEYANSQTSNYSLDDVPNSQDLPNVMRLNYGISIVNRNTMLSKRGLVGERPTFLILNDRESVDIDTMFDFDFAEYLYKRG